MGEISKNIYTEPMARTKRFARLLFSRHYQEPSLAMSDHYRPLTQRDLGKSAVEAMQVQLVLDGLTISPEQHARLNAPDHLR